MNLINQEYFSTEEISKVLRCSERQVVVLCEERKTPVFYTVPRKYKINYSEWLYAGSLDSERKDNQIIVFPNEKKKNSTTPQHENKDRIFELLPQYLGDILIDGYAEVKQLMPVEGLYVHITPVTTDVKKYILEYPLCRKEDLLIRKIDVLILLEQQSQESNSNDENVEIERKTSNVVEHPGDFLKTKIKSPQKRAHALHELISKLHLTVVEKKPRVIWGELIRISMEEDSIIQEMSQWTALKPVILWISPGGIEQVMKRNTFENYISKLNKSF